MSNLPDRVIGMYCPLCATWRGTLEDIRLHLNIFHDLDPNYSLVVGSDHRVTIHPMRGQLNERLPTG